MVECKTGKRKLRDSQRDFARMWPCPVIVARTGEEAVSEFWRLWKAYGMGALWRGPR